MPFLVYSLVGLSAFKLVIEAVAGNLVAPYLVFLDQILLGFLIAMILRTSIRKKEARKETLTSEVDRLKQIVED